MKIKFQSVWIKFTFTWISDIHFIDELLPTTSSPGPIRRFRSRMRNCLFFILMSYLYLIKFKPYVWFNHFWILSTVELWNKKTHSWWNSVAKITFGLWTRKIHSSFCRLFFFFRFKCASRFCQTNVQHQALSMTHIESSSLSFSLKLKIKSMIMC